MFRIQRDQAERNSLSSQDNESPVLNLSQSHSSDGEKLDNGSIKSDSDIIENDDINSNSDNMEYEDDVKEHAMDTNRNISEGGKITSMFGMMNHIQTLINTAVENAKHEEKQLLSEKSKFVYLAVIPQSAHKTHLGHLDIYPAGISFREENNIITFSYRFQ